MSDEQSKLPTEMILSRIFSTKNVESFITNNKAQLNIPTLAEHLEELCTQKGIKPSEVVKNADIDRFYGAKIFSGKRNNPHRDYIIRLAFGLRLNYEECQRLLVVARESELYPRIPRDALIIRCLHEKLTHQHTQERLYEAGMSILGEKCE
jgi:hypothetical protein